MATELIRCAWAGSDPLYQAYHDEEWGRPLHDDRRLFEMLILEGAQAGLSWITILKKRERYREVFAGFDPEQVARFDARKRAALLKDPGIVLAHGTGGSLGTRHVGSTVILERESLKWFKPARGQFQIFYKSGADHLEYQPDFVAETDDAIYMLEPKARNELDSQEVLAKQAAAVTWCQHASAHAASYGGKLWHYVLIPHDVIADNMTLQGLVQQYAIPF